MSLFRYEAVDGTGKVVQGAMNARDEQQVSQRLLSMGYTLRAVYTKGQQPIARSSAVSVGMAAVPAATAAASSANIPTNVKPKMNPSTLARFFRQMATLLHSGSPVYQSLSEVMPYVRNRRILNLLPRMMESVQAGQQLSGAMAANPDVFPVHVVASIWAGELGGRLETALEEVASDLEREASEVRYGRFGWGLAKLNWLGFILFYPMTALTNLLAPVLEKVLKSSGLRPDGSEMGPLDTILLMGKVYFKTMFWKSVLLIVGFCLLWIVLGWVKRIPAAKRFFDELLIRVPLWGRLHRDRSLARFLGTLDALYASGISPGMAWDAASLTPRNSAIAYKLRNARNSVRQDASVAELLTVAGVFDSDDIGLVSAGERAGRLPEALNNLSLLYTDRASAYNTRGRTASVLSLMLFLGFSAVYLFYRIASSYVAFAFKAAEIVGK